MSKVQSYRDLIVWQKAVDLVEHIYNISQNWPKHEQFGLTNQVRRAAVSVPSNIAEGQARQHTSEFRQFLFIALGSLAEVHTQLLIATRLGYVNQNDFGMLEKQVIEIQKMLRSLSSKLRA